MLTQKKNKQTAEEPTVETIVNTPATSTEIEETFHGNPIVDIYRTVESIIKDIPKDPDNPDGERLFKTVKWNMGQVARIKKSRLNEEYGNIAFPAVFLHFINVRGLIGTSRIGEFRAELRIQYVLNRLNCGDDEYQTEGAEVFQLINTALNDNRDKILAVSERFQFTYWDQPETFDDGLQPYWLTYDVWFKDYSTYRYKDYVDVYVVAPPFTNHSDQKPECNVNDHEDHILDNPDAAATFKTSV